MRFRSRRSRSRSRRKLTPLKLSLLGALFLACSVFAVFLFLRDINLAKASATWPTVSGTVKTSRVSTSTRKGKTKYSFDIGYDYAVNGQSYSGSRVRFGGAGNSKSSAEELTRKYPAGATVAVHYYPDNPSECTLETGAGGERYFVLIFPGAFFLIGLGMIIGAFYAKRPVAVTA